jgi:hypothetical protein
MKKCLRLAQANQISTPPTHQDYLRFRRFVIQVTSLERFHSVPYEHVRIRAMRSFSRSAGIEDPSYDCEHLIDRDSLHAEIIATRGLPVVVRIDTGTAGQASPKRRRIGGACSKKSGGLRSKQRDDVDRRE